jgi:hypothetical protein
VPGVAGAYILGLPFALGAFVAGGLAAAAMLFLSGRSGLKIDVIIGIIFTVIDVKPDGLHVVEIVGELPFDELQRLTGVPLKRLATAA